MKENYHDHYVDAIAYAFKATGMKKLPWYKIWWVKLKRKIRRLKFNRT